MANLELVRKKNLSTFRRLAIGTWKTAYDPSVYGTVEVRMDRAVKYIEDYREKTGAHLTVSHLVARAVAAALKKMPDANAILRFNRIYLRKKIAVFLQVAIVDEEKDKIDLSGVTLYDVDQKSLADIANEMDEKVEAVRKGTDKALEKSRRSFHYIPLFFMNFVMKLVAFLAFTLNLHLRFLNLPKDPFGSVMVTNVGSLGLDTAYVPIVPYSRVPILLALGKVRDVPVVEDGEVGIGQVMKINATFDHRFIDGVHAAIMSKVLHAWLEDPETHFGPREGGEAEAD